MSLPYLTKSRFIAGLQCPRKLWLQVHDPLPYAEPPPGSPLAVGSEIGVHAHKLFPGGILVAEEPWQHAEAEAKTRALIADPSVPAIFEAAFTFENIRVRVDVMERLPGCAWGLREVKSSGGVKEHYLDDIAVQAFVVQGSGVALQSAALVHVNKDFVRGETGIDWPAYFRVAECWPEIQARLASLPDRLKGLRAVLALGDAPQIDPGGHCHSPHSCDFWDSCTADKPADWIEYLPRLSARKRALLAEAGIEAISEIDEDFPLTAEQANIRQVILSGEAFVAPDLPKLLRNFGPPAFYLDFEAFNPALPLYPGTKPFQQIPFQWSLHGLDADGLLSHRDFLADGRTDPRRDFAESLIAALADQDWPILVYSSYEKTQLQNVAALFPGLAPLIEAIIARLRDLLPLVRNGIFLPQAPYGNSIKSIGPALCPDLTYDDLPDIADGAAASAAFGLIAAGALTQPEEIRMRQALLAYCERDTLAMVKVHAGLRGMA